MVVITDRYLYSSVFGSVDGLDKEWSWAINSRPSPDIVILLKVAPEECMVRIHKTRFSHELYEDVLRRVGCVRRNCKSGASVSCVNGERSKDVVAQDIVRIVTPYLKPAPVITFMKNLIPEIGLEVNVKLKTKRKMYGSCVNVSWWNAANEGEQKPNSAVCPICMGHPGTLPTVNAADLELGVRAALSLHCSILRHSKFDRKNYFYPDLPKGYQISQYDEPVAVNGYLDIELKDTHAPRSNVRVGITRLHLEEDAGKLMHESDTSLIDFNRAGTPLAEIVSEPDMISPQEAKLYLQELRLLMRYLGVSNADLEQGNMRADANISLHEVGNKIVPQNRIKNLNSFKAVERTLEYEIKRQTKLWEEVRLSADHHAGGMM